MKKTLLIVLISFGFLTACSKSKNDIVEVFEFAVYEDLPIFEDEYLYNKENRNGIKLTLDQTEWYLIDWNGNGIYDEVGIDYYGVKSPFKKRPIASKLRKRNTLNHNQKTYLINKETDFRELKSTELNPTNAISYISDYVPIKLTNGKFLSKDSFKDYDKTVIYYWATWCAPCVKKLEQVKLKIDKLAKDRINFVPIYYKCSLSEVLKLNEKKGFTFEAKEVSDLSALSYQLAGLPATYVFDRNGKLIAEKFDIE